VKRDNDGNLTLRTSLSQYFINSKLKKSKSVDWLDFETVLIIILHSPKFINVKTTIIAKKLLRNIDNKFTESFKLFKTEIYEKQILENDTNTSNNASEESPMILYDMNNDAEEENVLLRVAYSFGYRFGKQGVNQGPMYGELVKASFVKIISGLKEICDLKKTTRFLDVGCGLGKPNIHMAIMEEVALSIGIENQQLRYNLGMTVLQKFYQKTNTLPPRTMLVNADISNADTFVSNNYFNIPYYFF
jgi:hypothetical protein